MASPILAGESATTNPAFYKALILDGADPTPPETIAPACPILLSGGAVIPAMNPAIGKFLLLFFLIQSAAISSYSPPISPIIKIA